MRSEVNLLIPFPKRRQVTLILKDKFVLDFSRPISLLAPA